ncbi:MAG TPA: hypothetical protein PKL17_02935 [Pseudomonadota bacterium]|nr:hypothetical protein [Pseudomonadota bacterium]
MKSTLFSACALVGAMAIPAAASAQNCAVHFAAGFGSVSGSVAKATTQPAADVLVDQAFGPRPQHCEAGAYTSFLEQFENFGRTAIRTAQPTRGSKAPIAPVKENQLRLAISIVNKMSPQKVPLADSKTAPSQWRQVRSNLNAVADDAGNTPMMVQFLDAVGRISPPGPIEEVVTVGQGAPSGSSVATPGISAPPGGVQQVRVPLVPLPSWAVIKLYEARDLCKPQDIAGIQLRLQDVINWMESNTQPPQ